VLATLNRFLTLSRPPLPAKAVGFSRSRSKTAPRKGFLPISSFFSSYLVKERDLQKGLFMKNPVISYGILVIGIIALAAGIVLLKMGGHEKLPYGAIVAGVLLIIVGIVGAVMAAKAKSEGPQPEVAQPEAQA